MSSSKTSKPSSRTFWIAASLLVVANAGLAASFWPVVVSAAHRRADELVSAATSAQGSEQQLDFKVAQVLDPGNQRAAATVAASLLADGQPERALSVLSKAAKYGAGESSAMRAVTIKALLETNATDHAVAEADTLAPQATTAEQLQAVALAYAVGERTSQLAAQSARLSTSELARRVVTASAHKVALAQELYAMGLVRTSQRLLEPLPASVPRQLILGRLYEQLDTPASFGQARSAYTTAIELDPANRDARQGLIRSLQALGDNAAAKEQSALLKRLENGRP